jgi:hypothetical protein
MLGTFMPSIIRWINGRKQRRRFYKYMEQLLSKYETKDSEALNNYIAQLYAKGKINETQHKMLRDKIAEHNDRINKPRSPVNI